MDLISESSLEFLNKLMHRGYNTEKPFGGLASGVALCSSNLRLTVGQKQ